MKKTKMILNIVLPKIKKLMFQKILKSASPIFIKVSIILVTILCLFFYLSVSNVIAAIEGPHGDERIRSPKGVCATCHIPHKSKGPKIWARTSRKPGLYKGIHQLCQTCHDGTMFFKGDPIGDAGNSIEGYESGDYPPVNEYKGQFIVKTREDGENDIYASTGTDDVLDERESYSSWEGPFENHVMHGGADISLDSALIYFNPDIFPLDPTDEDSYPQTPADEKYRSGGAGFYCGTCHNPHKQPDDNFTGGFYLRTRPDHDVGDPWGNRKPFCSQCHGVIHAPENDCLECHHPHLGKRVITDDKEDEFIGRKIFRYEVKKTDFEATPNVLNINDSQDEDFPRASLCYGCHNDTEGNLWSQAGAVPIFGDNMDNKAGEHHPMGDQAWLGDSSKVSNGTFIRAPGTPLEVLNKKQEITCTSCHDGFHGSGPYKGPDAKEKNKKNNFLRWAFTNADRTEDPKSADPNVDSAAFCVKCHSDKNAISGKHLKNREDAFSHNVRREIFISDPNTGIIDQIEVGCANCMFCHFIHDGEERGNGDVYGTIRPDLDALMRIVPTKSLAWGDRSDDTDLNDYEDMCFGCHGEESIVGAPDSGLDSFLRPDSFFTHRFASAPDPNSPTIDNIIPGGEFPLADGPDVIITFDDYGAQAGNIYCGTCHDVHAQYNPNSPYLHSGKSPYVADGFCEACHDDKEGNFIRRSHPIAKGANSDPEQGSPTAETFPDIFTQWETSNPGSGQPGGVVSDGGEVICLTCHNTHAAATSYDGGIKGDSRKIHGKLLVMDNFPKNSTEPGDDLCRACHKGRTFADNGVNGAHKDELDETDERGICHNCHVPHNAQTANKIWAIKLEEEFAGVHDLCYSCHKSTQSGKENVFSKGKYENHVMFGGAVIKAGACPNAPSLFTEEVPGQFPWERIFDKATFPLDPNNKDKVPEKDNSNYCNRFTFSYNSGGDGFYCGTCHNPHKDLSKTSNGDGDYLRSKDEEETSIGLINIGKTGERKSFCIQCHGLIHAPGSDCLECHHPHKGKTFIEKDERIGRLIFSELSMFPKDFIALPNVPGITDDPNNDQYTSEFCYQCHNEEAQQHTEISPIFGEDAGDKEKEHHPMGTQASLMDPTKVRNGKFIRAPGTPAEFLNKNGQLTCTSCHDDFHGWGAFTDSVDRGKIKANFFLRWVLNDGDKKDKTDFCITCHDDKNLFNPDGKHLIDADDPNSPNGRRGCMFCHFIHDGKERQSGLNIIQNNGIRADVDALMRQEAISLVWKVGDVCSDDSCINNIDNDTYDYEDMCYGCHGDPNIVKGTGPAGSLLQPAGYFTHRYTCAPDANSPTSSKIKPGGTFPLSDGPDPETQNDYGTKTGHIFCGTCHNVHKGTNQPYLRSDHSPYEACGFCEACHDKDGEFVSKSHPIGLGPNPDPAQGAPTAAQFADTYNGNGALFSQGGSGNPGGITSPFNPATGKSTQSGSGQVICLTCHNTHAAVTSWEGKTETDMSTDHGYLLVKDNMRQREDTSPGSELCKACHPFGDSEYSFPEGAHGDGTLSGGQGICNACHTPHGATGPKLWSIECPSSEDPGRGCYDLGPFQGFRQLCFSCHNKSYVILGSETVFKGVADLGASIPGDYLEDHVMRYWADIEGAKNFDTQYFPLDPNDQDAIPTKFKPDPNSNEGFYCGSCHNPHKQPKLKSGGRYLRSKDGNVGYPGNRKVFCDHCHKKGEDVAHKDQPQEGKECLECHHPHMGKTRIDNDPDVGRLILIIDYERQRFQALPNVSITDTEDVSSTCYGCHRFYPEDPNNLNWSDLGATYILGDDVSSYQDANSDIQTQEKDQGLMPREHHPMGKQARFGQSLRALGAERSLFNKHGELTCTSCHSGNHKGDRENNYLRWNFVGDDPHFCSRCHKNKQGERLGPLGVKHHQTRETSPVKRIIHERLKEDNKSVNKEITVGSANCMFCHFIHDGQDQGDTLTISTNTLMRIQPKNLRWADAWEDEDNLDYEDLCYGCHSQEKIVGGVGGFGSLFLPPQDLDPEQAADPFLARRFSHRFRSKPNPSSPTSIRLKSGGPLPLSDGTGEMILNDYGTEPGRMYCGTCHDVHTWSANPGTAKYHRGFTSAYAPVGFCHECHSSESIPNVCTPAINHPPALIPGGISALPSVTWSNVDPATARGKGDKGGFIAPAGSAPNISQITCLTCHNIHAAETTYDGFPDRPRSDDTALIDGRHGKLLIIDNGHGPAGSDLCIICHPEHSRIIGSFHDFSHRGLDGLGGGIATKGTCSACHRPHLASGERLLWARPMIEERVLFGAIPGFVLGSTIFCYDCHSGIACDADPLPDLFLPFPPQDVAFMDGPGGLFAGYYENLPAFVQDIPPHRIPAGMPTEIKTSGHYIRQPIVTPGIAQNNKLPCNDCHNPHFGITIEGIANQAFIKPVIGGKPVGPYKASINMTYHKEIRDNLQSRQVCVACHGLAERPNAPVYPPATFTDVNPAYKSILLLGRPPSTVYDHFDAGLYACTDCHRHNRAMVLCIDCHGYPPVKVGDGWSGPGDPDQNYIGGAGAHYVHVVEHKFPCTMCHQGCLHDPGGATVVNPSFKRAKVNIDFDMSYAFPRTSGEFQTRMGYYGQDGKPLILPEFDGIKQTCKVGCHSPLVGDPDEPPNLNTESPSWSLNPQQAPTSPTFPGGSGAPSWITIRTPYPLPNSVPGTWQWLVTWGSL